MIKNNPVLPIRTDFDDTIPAPTMGTVGSVGNVKESIVVEKIGNMPSHEDAPKNEPAAWSVPN